VSQLRLGNDQKHPISRPEQAEARRLGFDCRSYIMAGWISRVKVRRSTAVSGTIVSRRGGSADSDLQCRGNGLLTTVITNDSMREQRMEHKHCGILYGVYSTDYLSGNGGQGDTTMSFDMEV
jgi:hypothetical protein